MQTAQNVDIRKLPALAKREMEHARLPALYVAARTALAECVRVDECKDIADKHAAMAHYAKQVKDQTLRHYAERVYLRAMARLGELLAAVQPKERPRVAKAHGISESSLRNSVAVAAMHPDSRVRRIESRKGPPSLSKLAHQSLRVRGLSPRHKADSTVSATAAKVRGTATGRACLLLDALLAALASPDADCTYSGPEGVVEEPTELLDPVQMARAIPKADAKYVRRLGARVRDWADSFVDSLPDR